MHCKRECEGASHIHILSLENLPKFGHQNYHFSTEHFGFNSQMFHHFFSLILLLIYFGYYRDCQSSKEDAAVLMPDLQTLYL